MRGRVPPGGDEQRLLDLWSPPEGAGEPVGCVATSFTFSASLFEEECLARFAGITSDPESDGAAWLIEREERLAALACAVALVDARHCRGRRSLRWDLVPVRVPGAALHAKVSVLLWARRLRLIVASANLTEEGYRRNQEVAGVLDYGADTPGPRSCLEGILSLLEEVVGYSDAGPAGARCRAFVADVRRRAEGWCGRDTSRVRLVITGPGRPSALDQLRGQWERRARERPSAATVVSPFFDPPMCPSNAPVRALWGLMRRRVESTVTWCVPAHEDEDGTVHLHAPESLVRDAPAREGAITRFRRVPEEVEVEEGTVIRPLHAKMVLLEGVRWVGLMVGSSNFTSSGLGLSSRPNLEANLFYLADREREPERAAALRASMVEALEVDGDAGLWRWEPLPDETETLDGPPVLHPAFADAVYEAGRDGPRLVLTLRGDPPAGWRVFEEGRSGALMDESRWRATGGPRSIVIPWNAEEPPPSGLEVSWGGVQGRAWWPVQVADGGVLPPPRELRGLDLDTLIRILTSARPLHQVLREASRRRGGPTRVAENDVDPHARVDTHAFLIRRARRVAWALRGMRMRLEEPLHTEAALEWRLHGPVGPLALARALRVEAGRPTPHGKGAAPSPPEDFRAAAAEQAFLLAELALELAHVQPREAPGSLPASRVRAAVGEIVEAVGKEAVSAASAADAGMAAYVREAVERALARVRGEAA